MYNTWAKCDFYWPCKFVIVKIEMYFEIGEGTGHDWNDKVLMMGKRWKERVRERKIAKIKEERGRESNRE